MWSLIIVILLLSNEKLVIRADKGVMDWQAESVHSSEDKHDFTKPTFYWIEKDIQGEKHPNTAFPVYNLD